MWRALFILSVPGLILGFAPLGLCRDTEDGETMETAWVVDHVPFVHSETSCGHIDDYTEGSTPTGGPDLVYRYTPSTDTELMVGLAASDFATSLYVYHLDGGYGFGSPLAISQHPSEPRLYRVAVEAGETYHVVVDGSAGDPCGDYTVVISQMDTGGLVCPAEAMPEWEGPLYPDYVDDWNGGCGLPGDPLMYLSGDQYGCLILGSSSGYYTSGGDPSRDEDLYSVFGYGAPMSVEITPAHDTIISQLTFDPALRCAGEVSTLASLQVEAGVSTRFDLTGEHGVEVWVMVTPAETGGDPEALEYLYIAEFRGIDNGTGLPAVLSTHWSTIKELFR